MRRRIATRSVAHGRTLCADRGPDDESFFISDPKAGSRQLSVLDFVGLSIIDLSGGRQPMCNEDGTLRLVCNGEIYNFPEIKKRLVASGHKFKTGSDVEVLLHLYEEHGEDCIQHVNGMFAFAIWDATNQKLFLGRDRLGKKPLYYRDTPTQIHFRFGNKSLARASRLPPRVGSAQPQPLSGLRIRSRAAQHL